MTDATAADRTAEHIRKTLVALRAEVDSRMLFCALMANAGVLAEMLIAAKVVDKQWVTGVFAAAFEDATTPVKHERPIAVHYTDGVDKPPRKKH